MTETPPPPSPAKLSGAALVAALVVLLAFTSFVVFLIVERTADERTWTRLAWLFASVEAIAFGAAGALFGSSIQRERAEKAEAAAEKNAEAASNGKALAEVVKADAPGAGVAGLESLGAGADTVAARHAAVAHRLFP